MSTDFSNLGSRPSGSNSASTSGTTSPNLLKRNSGNGTSRLAVLTSGGDCSGMVSQFNCVSSSF